MASVERLIFLHIAKAGGTTFEDVLERYYDRESIYTLDNWDTVAAIERLRQTPLQDLQHVRLLRGHMPFGLHQYLPGPARYITFLRDPVERLISMYYFVLRTPAHYLYKAVAEHNMDLETFVTSPLSPELDNSQTKAISGNFTHYGCCTSADLEAAKANLRDWFEVTGITERYDESLLLIKRRLGWRRSPFYTRANVTRARPNAKAVPSRVLDAIQRTNALDLQLYRHAVELHRAAVEAEGRSFARELKWFRLINKGYQIIRGR